MAGSPSAKRSGGPGCAASPASPVWHNSRLVPALPLTDSAVQVSAGLWRLESDSVVAGGVLLEFSLGEDVDRWPIDSAQSYALLHLMRRLLRRDRALPKVV